MLKNKRVKIILLSLIGVVSLFFILKKTDKQSQMEAQVKKGKFEVTVINTGELRAKNFTEVIAPMGLRNLAIWQIKISNLIPEGTVVNEGDLVAELDKTEIMNKLSEATLNFQKKQSEFTQNQLDTTLTMRDARDELLNLKYAVEEKRLMKDQSVYEAPAILRQAEIEYEKSLRSYEQKKENYQTKQAQSRTKMQIIASDLAKEKGKMDQLIGIIEELRIKAPKSGMLIYARDWDGKKKIVGSMINTWNPTVAALPDLTVMESVTYINEVDIQKVKVGQIVNIGLDAQPEKRLNGVIKSVASIGEQKPKSNSKVFEVLIDVEERDTTLRPGMTTSNNIVTHTLPEALYIPLEAIFTENSRSYVYKRNGGSLVRQQIKLGEMNDRDAVILKGLETDDRVLLSAPSDTTGISFVPLN
jgi:multidrug efflux pump subunit AcrA (membrane-fusion protein)